MKKLIIIAITNLLFAKYIYINHTKFLVDERNIKNINNVCFYKDGFVNNKNCYKISGKILIRDEKIAKQIEKKYNLKIVGKIGNFIILKGKKEIIFNLLLDEKFNKNITPIWISPRKLR
jgi:hypothetical protein